MFEVSSSFSRACQPVDDYSGGDDILKNCRLDHQLQELKDIGRFYEAFFKRQDIAVKTSTLTREGNSYPVLIIIPQPGNMEKLSDCMAMLGDKVCSHMKGVCLQDISFELEPSRRNPACFALVAHHGIVRDFGEQLCNMHIQAEAVPAPTPNR